MGFWICARGASREEVGEPGPTALGLLSLRPCGGLFLRLVANVAGRRLQRRRSAGACRALPWSSSRHARCGRLPDMLSPLTLLTMASRARRRRHPSRAQSHRPAWQRLCRERPFPKPRASKKQLIEMESRWSFPHPSPRATAADGLRRRLPGGERKRAPCVPPEVVVEERGEQQWHGLTRPRRR